MAGDERRAVPFPAGPLPPPWPRLLAAVAAAYGAVLLYATHHPKPEELVGTNAPNDKTLHFLAYGALAAVVSAAVAARGGWTVRSAASLFALLALFAALDELTQPFFGRSADAVDWSYDQIGLLVGGAAVTLAVRLARRGGGDQ